jgi:small nuclear ribonucleoprotein D2
MTEDQDYSQQQQQEATAAATADLKSGPFSVLYKAVQGNTQVLVNVRNNHKLLGRVKAYDRHMNLCVRTCVCVCVCIHSFFLL